MCNITHPYNDECPKCKSAVTVVDSLCRCYVCGWKSHDDNYIPTICNNRDGLHQHYNIEKSDGSSVNPKAVYFVLRLDKYGADKAHIRACREAAKTYAEHILDDTEGGHLELTARELFTLVSHLNIEDEL